MLELVFAWRYGTSLRAVSRLSATIPHAASRRSTAPRFASRLRRT